MAYRRCPTCWEKHSLQETICISCGTRLVAAEVFKEAGDNEVERRPPPVITQRSAGKVTILEFAGLFVDAAAAGRIQDCISRQLEQGRRQIVVDLSEVSAMDMTCVGELVRAFTKVAGSGGVIKLMNVTKRIGPFGLDGAVRLFTVFETFERESDALQSFERAEE